MTIKVDKINVRINFIESILGSAPADPDIFTRFVSARAPSPWLQAEENDTIPERTQDTGATVFHCDDKGLFLYDYHIKGFLKEAGNVLKNTDGIKIKNLRSKIDNYVFIRPRRIYLMRNGKPIQEEDEILERPLRGMTARGERVSLVKSEVVHTPCYIECTVEVLQHKEVKPAVIRKLLGYGRYKGIGQWRNGGWGRFEWEEVKEIETMTAAK